MGGDKMSEKTLEQFLNEMNSVEVVDDSKKMESTQSDLFDVLMGRCPPTSIIK